MSNLLWGRTNCSHQWAVLFSSSFVQLSLTIIFFLITSINFYFCDQCVDNDQDQVYDQDRDLERDQEEEEEDDEEEDDPEEEDEEDFDSDLFLLFDLL
ncbi:MAG: hypothetical protein EZS28_012187 [Streblomastix strix]|uniref:Uncharacterized protein n=1 Tax=Streblomastix strix TaxID=222440 RepID=A0A5J4WBG2_9EUKA|nr:MAG: hypothetical protein EZS28_012187 [Streblomastix strix]